MPNETPKTIEPQKGSPLPTKQVPPTEPAKVPTEKPKEKPKAKKDESLKYDLTYANGGFNDGVEIKPGKNGSLEMKITLYGGGEQKVLNIKHLPNQIQTLLKGYEVGASNNDTTTPEITQQLQGYFLQIKEKISFDIIKFMQELDDKIEQSIKEAIKGN